MSGSVHPVDEVLPPSRLATLGLQHVLVMYAGAVAVPLIIGRALKLPPEQVALLINAGLFGILVVPFMSRLLPLFPPVVTGTIIIVIGISLMGGRYQLGQRRPADGHQGGRRPGGPVPQPSLQGTRRPPDRAVRARGDPGDHPLRPRLPR